MMGSVRMISWRRRESNEQELSLSINDGFVSDAVEFETNTSCNGERKERKCASVMCFVVHYLV